ncbi:MAG: hypothetical protein MPF33_05600 [Candidatus Aramenus sp.]|nr:hypothetical protein [Candidatus Aramenus sp.]
MVTVVVLVTVAVLVTVLNEVEGDERGPMEATSHESTDQSPVPSAVTPSTAVQYSPRQGRSPGSS